MAETLLVVDDDRTVLLLLSSLLTAERFTVVTAADGEEARSLIEADLCRFSAIILDWQMPGLTGIELLRWIKDQREMDNIPVIMQTAMDSEEHIQEGIEAGAFYYLTKPVRPDLLLSIVRAALTDARYKISLLKKLAESQNPLQHLVEGLFRFRTVEEGERLALWIANACPEPDKAMGINELFVNAVEHGNLGIGYRDKTNLVADGTWLEEVHRRLALPEHRHKFVEVALKRSPSALEVTVNDTGPGFDFRKYLGFDEERVFDNHGRGIAMAGSSVELTYMGNGSSVRITIPLILPPATAEERAS
jgi:DNA-binding response OmpR family regulator